MRKNRIWMLVLAVLLAAWMPGMAQKALRTVKNYLKEDKPSEALNEINRLRADSTSDVRFSPRLYHYAVEANIALNNVENEKLYLHQAYDTAKFFTTTYDLFDNIIRCEQYEQQLLAQKGKKFKYHKTHGTLMHSYYRNLGVAAHYYYRKANYAEAMKFLELFLEVPELPIWGSDKSVTSSKLYLQNAFLYQRCAYRSKQYDRVGRYSAVTLRDSSRRRCGSLEYMAQAAKAEGDSIAFLRYIRMGIEDYPQHPYFFAQLAGYYAQRQAYRPLVLLADSMLQRDSTNLRYMEAKAMAYLNLRQYDEAIRVAQAGLATDSMAAEMDYFIGLAYCSLASAVALPTNINTAAYRRASAERKAYYTAARPHLERYRRLEPEKVSRWAPLLYHVYFALNEGEKFEEINKVLEKLFS